METWNIDLMDSVSKKSYKILRKLDIIGHRGVFQEYNVL